MTHKFRRLHAGLLAVLLVLTMVACEIPETPTGANDPSVPTIDPSGVVHTAPSDNVTLPDLLPTQGNIKVEQARVSGYDENWISRYNNLLGDYVVADSVQALTDALDQIRSMGKEFTVNDYYDAEFFQDNFLVLFPGQTTSGSVRFELEATLEGDTLTITASGVLNGVGTADMADWLLIAVLPREKYPTDAQIVIKAGSAKRPESGMDIHDK